MQIKLYKSVKGWFLITNLGIAEVHIFEVLFVRVPRRVSLNSEKRLKVEESSR